MKPTAGTLLEQFHLPMSLVRMKQLLVQHRSSSFFAQIDTSDDFLLAFDLFRLPSDVVPSNLRGIIVIVYHPTTTPAQRYSSPHPIPLRLSWCSLSRRRPTVGPKASPRSDWIVFPAICPPRGHDGGAPEHLLRETFYPLFLKEMPQTKAVETCPLGSSLVMILADLNQGEAATEGLSIVFFEFTFIQASLLC